MNLRLAEAWERAGRWTLIALAFLLPVAVYLRTFDPSLIKDVDLAAGACLAAAFAVLRALELGRFELPRNRTALFWAAAALAAWLARRAPTSFAAATAAAGPVLFLLALAGPASYGFGAALADAALLAGAAAGALSLVPSGALAGPLVPLAVCRSLDRGRAAPFRAAALAAAAICARAALLDPAGRLPLAAASAAALLGLGALWGRRTSRRTALELALGSAAAGWAASLGGLPASDAPAALAWLFAGALAGLALEKGASVVRVLAIPAPPLARRALYVPVAAALAFALAGPISAFESDYECNWGAYFAKQGRRDEALAALARVPADSPDGAAARYLAAGVRLERGGQGDAEIALALYEWVEKLSPSFARTRYQEGLALWKLGRFGESADRFKAYARLEPASKEAFEKLAEVATIAGRTQDAQDAALKLAELERAEKARNVAAGPKGPPDAP